MPNSTNYQLEWESKASVKHKNRTIFMSDQTGYFYPLSRQLICLHPLVENMDPQVINYLLTQSFYKYLNDIAIIETRVINQAILNVLNNNIGLTFDSEQKIKLHTVMIDEAYHAYIAYDAILQIQNHTHIKPLPLPKTIEIEYAIEKIKNKMDAQYHNLFDFIAICLAENTLTKTIVDLLEEDHTNPFFKKLLSDHLTDESRHSGIFFHLLKYIWENISKECKSNIAPLIPEFLVLYLNVTIQKEFDRQLLTAIELDIAMIDIIIEDTYSDFKLTPYHPLLKNILIIIKKAGMLDEQMLSKLREYDWIAT